jgi:SAM-dependent methyltransferase
MIAENPAGSESGPDLGYFQRLYTVTADPWSIGVGFYERRKRNLLLDCLPQQRFRLGFEPGCGTGELTARLATRCDTLLAADAAEQAVRLTRERMVEVGSVRVERLLVPDEWPSGPFDLIVLSEIGYFMTAEAWSELADRASQSLAESGTIAACHWSHPFAERRSETADLHRRLGEALADSARHTVQLQDEDFLLDVWTSAPLSPAQQEGRR